MSDGGVADQVFLNLQADAIRQANRSKHSIKQAVPFLESNGLGVSFRLPSLLLNLLRLLHLDIGDVDDAIEDEFLDRCLEFSITHVLRTIKHKARVLVPNAVTLVGVPDAYDFIPAGCIYARIERQGESPTVLSGPIAISRSPSEHPVSTNPLLASQICLITHRVSYRVFESFGHADVHRRRANVQCVCRRGSSDRKRSDLPSELRGVQY